MTPYPPEAGRYHLWLAWNCTWSQRTLIARNLLGLDDVISYSIAHWHRNDGGWWYRKGVDEPKELDDLLWVAGRALRRRRRRVNTREPTPRCARGVVLD